MPNTERVQPTVNTGGAILNTLSTAVNSRINTVNTSNKLLLISTNMNVDSSTNYNALFEQWNDIVYDDPPPKKLEIHEHETKPSEQL